MVNEACQLFPGVTGRAVSHGASLPVLMHFSPGDHLCLESILPYAPPLPHKST